MPWHLAIAWIPTGDFGCSLLWHGALTYPGASAPPCHDYMQYRRCDAMLMEIRERWDQMQGGVHNTTTRYERLVVELRLDTPSHGLKLQRYTAVISSIRTSCNLPLLVARPYSTGPELPGGGIAASMAANQHLKSISGRRPITVIIPRLGKI